MFRGNLENQTYITPLVESVNPQTWPHDDNTSQNFWGFVAHDYKGYHYYTGSDFPAEKATEAVFARTDKALLVHARMADPVMALAVKHMQDTEPDFFMADHLTVNIITPGSDRYLFAVNPLARTHSECNADRDAGLQFETTVSVNDDGWEVLFTIPFSTLNITDPNTTALAFDVVRQEQGDSAVSTLTRAQVSPPYNAIYEYPIFHFSLLKLGPDAVVDPSLFTDASEGARAALRSDKEIEVDSFCELVLDIDVGKSGLVPGAHMRIYPATGVLNCGVPWTEPLDWEAVQAANPRASGYMSIEGGEFTIEPSNVFVLATYTGDQPLPPHAKLTLRIGDRRFGGPGIRAQKVTDARHRIIINIDPLRRHMLEPIQPWPEVSMVSGPAATFIVSNPGAVPAGEFFEICIRAVDRIGNIASGFTGTVALNLDAKDHTFPTQLTFTESDDGVKILKGTIRDKGVFSATVLCGALTGQGNFVATDGSFGKGRLVFGDIHCHTCTSDGWRTPEDKMVESRHLRGLQFMALADHDFDMAADKWNHYKALAKASDEPGSFIPFLAHEWTPSAGHGKPFHRKNIGHYVIIFPEFEGDLLRANDMASNTPDKLFALARERGDLMIIPHYHGSRPPIDPEISYALEIAAWDGKIAESPAHAPRSVFESLNDGYKVGVIAGTDHGGEGLTAFRNGEMLGAWVTEFSRDGIRDAIKQRRTLAITHTRVLLNFTMNGHPMGSDVAVNRDEARTFDVKVACRPYPARVQIIRNGEVIDTFSNVGRDGGVPIVNCTFTDDSPLDKAAWYLIRVMLHGGEHSWSSPVWATAE
jgi:hypothetical protein